MTGTGPLTAAVRGAGRLVRPVLAAAALVLLLLIVPGRGRHPALQAAEAVHEALDVPAAWLRWTLRQDPPAPETVILQFGEAAP